MTLKHREKLRIARRMCEGMSRHHPFFFGFGPFRLIQWEKRAEGIQNRVKKQVAATKKRVAEKKEKAKHEKVAESQVPVLPSTTKSPKRTRKVAS